MNVVRSFVNYAIFHELCDRMRFEVDCAKSHHRVISEGLLVGQVGVLAYPRELHGLPSRVLGSTFAIVFSCGGNANNYTHNPGVLTVREKGWPLQYYGIGSTR